jgi:iron complex transport system substrate-binding protein
MPAPRVVSLLPAATEIICALGAGELLVGRSHECDFPETVRALPACTTSEIDSSQSSRAIDDAVKARLRQALSLYQVDTARLRELRPDVIVTQAQCKVCAVSLSEVEQAVASWMGAQPVIVSLAPEKLTQVWDNITEVASALGLQHAGRHLLKTLKTRVVGVIEKACVLKQRPTVGCIEWFEPLMAAGNWVPELVDLAGGKDVLGEPGKHSPWLNWETLRERDPEVLVLMPCGFDLARTRSELNALTARPEWAQLRAVKSGRVFLTDGNSFFNRPGPRLVESIEILAEILHPQLFQFGHAGKGWQKLA